PDPPTIVSATSDPATVNIITLTWTNPANGGDKYIIKWEAINPSDSNDKDNTEVEGSTTTYNITGLTAGVEYNITMQARKGSNGLSSEEVTSGKTHPASPRNLRVTARDTTTSMKIAWDAPSEGTVESYKVNCSGGQVKNIDGVTADIEGLTAGTEYTITIKAVSNELQSLPYGKKEYTTPAKPGDITVPEESRTINSLVVNWGVQTGHVESYVVTCTGGGAVGTVDKENRRVTITGLSPGTAYDITVKAKIGSMESEEQKITGIYTEPNKPGTVTVDNEDVTITEAKVKWTKGDGNADKFKLECLEVTDSRVVFTDDNIAGTSREETCTGLYPGRNHTARVTAMTNGGTVSEPTSSPEFVTKPLPVQNVTITNTQGTTDLTATWTTPTGTDVSSFKVQLLTVDSDPEDVETVLTKTWNDLVPAKQYTVSVWVVSNGQQSTNTDGTGKVCPSIPIEVSSEVTKKELTVNWLKSDGHDDPDAYEVTINAPQMKRTVGGDKRTAQFTGLTPGKRYDISVVAKVSSPECFSDPATSNATMDEDTPSPPQSPSLGEVLDTAVTLNYIPPLEPNGVIQYYIIEIEHPNRTVFSENTTGPETSYTVENLKPAQDYKFWVKAKNVAYTSARSNVVTTKTKEAMSKAVATFSLESKTHISLEYTWTYPSEPNGVISQYILRIFNKDKDECVIGVIYNCDECVSSQDTQANITKVIENCRTNKTVPFNEKDRTFTYNTTEELIPYDMYEATVWPVNTVGRGHEAELSNRTEEWYPGRMAPPTISDIQERQFTVTWEPPSAPNGVIIQYQYSYYAGEDVGNNITKDVNETYVVIAGSPCINYTVAIKAKTKVGFAIEGFSPPSSATLLTNTPSIPTGLKVENKSSTELRATWTPPAETCPFNFNIFLYDTQNPGDNPRNATLDKNTTEKVFEDLRKYWSYTVVVRAVTDKSPGPNATLDQKTSEDFPGPVQNVNTTVVENACATVRVTWNEPLPKEKNGLIGRYYITYAGNRTNKLDHSGSVMVTAEENNSGYTKDMKLNAEYNYTISVLANTGVGNASNSSIKSSEVSRLSACNPTLPTELNNPETVFSAPGKPEGDARSQIVVSIPEDFFNNDANGDITDQGIIVVDGDRVSDNNKLGREGIVHVKGSNITYGGIKSDEIFQFYRPTPKCWLLSSCPSMTVQDGRKRRATTEVPKTYTVGTDNSDCGGHCNGPLKANRPYRVRGFVCTTVGCTQTAFGQPIKTDADQTGAIVGGVIGGLLAAVLIALIVLFLMKRRRDQPQGKDPMRREMSTATGTRLSQMVQDNPGFINDENTYEEFDSFQPKSRPVKLADFPAHVVNMHRNTDLLFSEEYKAVKMLCAKTPHAPLSTTNTNTSKNRYTNILPYDQSRVKLLPTDDDEGSDYINANYMVGYNSPREFIAAQGPLPGTKDDFWRMIWEQNVSLIVMVTQLIERGRVKCEQYWPKEVGEPEFFGDLQVTLRSQSVLADYTIRVLDVTLGSTSRTLKHFNYTMWPDFGCPDTTESLLNFVRVTRGYITPDVTGPICIHCSAGVGRTGTFIAVDRLLQHMKAHDSLDIFGIVMEMREYRCNMVQTEDQYIFIHDCINDVLKAEAAQDQQNGQQNGQVAERAV
ncbi:unnamed protein product, partial [Owenia fusiformis]